MDPEPDQIAQGKEGSSSAASSPPPFAPPLVLLRRRRRRPGPRRRPAFRREWSHSPTASWTCGPWNPRS